MSVMRLAGLLLPALAALSPCAAAAETSRIAALTTPFGEHMAERVMVGGHSLVGVVATPTADLPAGTGLVDGRLLLPGALAGPVCVRARTEDGRYEAENTYSPVAIADGVHSLDWSTKYQDRLLTQPLRQLAALTTVGPCESPSSVVVPTGMGGVGTPNETYIQVLVNTRGAPTWAVLRDPAGGPALARRHCTRLEDGARVAYDARCLLGPLPARPDVELRIEQEGRDGSSMEVVAKVTLRTAPSP